MLSVQKPFRLFGGHFEIDGPHRFVRVLRALFRRVKIGLFGRVLRAVDRADTAQRVRLRLRGNTHGVRSHIGDEGDMVAAFRFDALVQMLREAHRFGGSESQLVRRVLLHGASGERRGRVRLRHRFFHFGNDVFAPFQLL